MIIVAPLMIVGPSPLHCRTTLRLLHKEDIFQAASISLVSPALELGNCQNPILTSTMRVWGLPLLHYFRNHWNFGIMAIIKGEGSGRVLARKKIKEGGWFCDQRIFVVFLTTSKIFCLRNGGLPPSFPLWLDP